VKYKSFQMVCLIALTAIAFAAAPVYGQVFFDGGGEVSAMGGVAFGGLGARPIVSGSAGADITRYAMVLAEAAMIPISSQTLLPANANTVRGSDLFDFNVALQGRIPIKRWEPYGMLGTAVLMNPYTAGFLGPNGTVVYVGERHSKFALEGGGGCRYYAGEKWGVRVEYRYTSSARNFNRIQGGLFYRLEGDSLFTFLPAIGRRLRR
jgi:opacity protein-like surface antigen